MRLITLAAAVLAGLMCLVSPSDGGRARVALSVRASVGVPSTIVSTGRLSTFCSPWSRGTTIVYRAGGLIISTGGFGCWPCGCYIGWGHHYCGGHTGSPPDTRTLEALARKNDPQLLGEETETVEIVPSGPLATARQALSAGDATSARLAVAEVLSDAESPDRGEALLLLGMAQVVEQAFTDAGRTFEQAYEVDATLKGEKLEGVAILGSADRVRSATQRATRVAKKSPSREAWFAVAVLLHAQGKEGKANQFIDRALTMPSSSAPEPAPVATP